MKTIEDLRKQMEIEFLKSISYEEINDMFNQLNDKLKLAKQKLISEPQNGAEGLDESIETILFSAYETGKSNNVYFKDWFKRNNVLDRVKDLFSHLNKPKQVTEDEIEMMANQEYPDDVFGRGNFINGAKWMLENNITLKEPKVLDSFKPCAECGKLKMIGVQCKNHNGVCSLPSSMLKEPKGDSVQTERESAYVVFEDSHEHEALIQLSVTIHDLEKAREYAKGWKNKTLYIYKFIE